MIRARAAAAALLAAACAIPEEGPMMAPGEDCLECHGGGGEESDDARAWTLAGTVYPTKETADPGAGVRGAEIRVLDAGGKSFTLRSNRAGNFYTAEPLALPVAVWVNGDLMPLDTPGYTHLSCNRCHQPGTAAGRVAAGGG
jgi:hypothetical protein